MTRGGVMAPTFFWLVRAPARRRSCRAVLDEAAASLVALRWDGSGLTHNDTTVEDLGGGGGGGEGRAGMNRTGSLY